MLIRKYDLSEKAGVSFGALPPQFGTRILLQPVYSVLEIYKTILFYTLYEQKDIILFMLHFRRSELINAGQLNIDVRMYMDTENLSEINNGGLFYTVVTFNRPSCVNNLRALIHKYF